jgi:hypothetical protein
MNDFNYVAGDEREEHEKCAIMSAIARDRSELLVIRSPESSPATLILDDAEPSEDSATGVQSVGIDRRTVLNRSQGQNELVGAR